MAFDELGDGVEEDLRALESLQAPDETDDLRAERNAELAAGSLGGAIVAGGEALHIRARGDDGDAGRDGVVPHLQIIDLSWGVDHEQISIVHDLLLADAPGLRLAAIAVGQGVVLRVGEGVGGMHPGDLPKVAEQPRHLAGEPVVGMDHIVGGGMLLDPCEDAAGEDDHLGGQIFLREPLEGASYAVDDAHVRLHGDHAGMWSGSAGEHVHLDAHTGELTCRVVDVHVHASRITGAGLLERRGVHGNNCDAHGGDFRRGQGLTTPDVNPLTQIVSFS